MSKFKAFEELTVTKNDSNFEFEVPWMKIELHCQNESTTQNFLEFQKAISVEERQRTPRQHDVIDDILSALTDFNFGYIDNSQEPLPPVSPNVQEEFGATTHQLEEKFIEEIRERIGFEQGAWNNETILAKSFIRENEYDPVKAYFFILRERLLTEVGLKRRTSMLELLRQLADTNFTAFKHKMSVLLSQMYYFTSKCHFAVSPALKNQQLPASVISKFLKEEKDHHLLIQDSFQKVSTGSPREAASLYEDIFVYASTSVDILKFCAENNPFGFACLLACFEGQTLGEKDPIAQLLIDKGLPAAAWGIQKHFEINKKHNHATVGLDIAKQLAAQTYRQLTSAIQWVEIAEFCHNKVAEKIADDN